MIKSFSTSSKFLRPNVSRLEDSLKFSADFLEELKILQFSWEPFFSWEPVAYRKHCFPLLPTLPWKREVKVGEKVRASMTNRAGTASSSTWTSANELASRKKDKYCFSYCFTPRCLQSQSDGASCLRTKVWDQTLNLWSTSTDSKTLHDQRTYPREYQIVTTHTKETTWLQDLVSHNHQWQPVQDASFKQQTKQKSKPTNQQIGLPPHSSLTIREEKQTNKQNKMKAKTTTTTTTTTTTQYKSHPIWSLDKLLEQP